MSAETAGLLTAAVRARGELTVVHRLRGTDERPVRLETAVLLLRRSSQTLCTDVGNSGCFIRLECVNTYGIGTPL